MVSDMQSREILPATAQLVPLELGRDIFDHTQSPVPIRTQTFEEYTGHLTVAASAPITEPVSRLQTRRGSFFSAIAHAIGVRPG